MKYSFMTFSMPGADAAALADAAVRFGYDGVELRVGQGSHGVGYDADAAQLARVRAAFEARGVAVSCLATSVAFAYAPEAAAAECAEALRVADAVGAGRVRVFGGFLRSEDDRAGARANILAGLRAAARDAERYGVNLCFELHDSWSEPNEAGALLAEVGHPRVKCNWDVMHPVLECGVAVADSYAPIAPFVDHVHMHDGRKVNGVHVFLPIGTAEIDHRPAVAALLEAGYTGFLSGEWIGRDDPEDYLPAEVATMRRYEAEYLAARR